MVLVLMIVGLTGSTVAGPIEAERFGPLDALIGRWRGHTERPDGSPPGLVERTYAYVLGGLFVRAESIVTFPPEIPDAHQDVRYEQQWISFDVEGDRFVARGFFSEGFATLETITIESAPLRIVIESESIENGPSGMRTRHTLTLDGEDRLTDVFEIAMPGIGYRTYHTAHLQRDGG